MLTIRNISQLRARAGRQMDRREDKETVAVSIYVLVTWKVAGEKRSVGSPSVRAGMKVAGSQR